MMATDAVREIHSGCGSPLLPADYALLERSWITPELADQADLRRVSSVEGAEIVGRKDNGSYAGIAFVFRWPGETYIRERWIRRDAPEIEIGGDGKRKEKNKYLGPPGRGNLVYITPRTAPDLVSDISVPILITEGAKKTLALHRLAHHGRSDGELRRFLPLGLNGVWGFLGKIGKSPGPDGSARDEKGVVADLRRLTWAGRTVFIAFDSNVGTNPKIAFARRQLTAKLLELGAGVVRWVHVPEVPGVNGIDDLLYQWGPERVLQLITASEPAPAIEPPQSQAQRLIAMCEGIELFRTPDGESYAHVPVHQHHETLLLRGRGFSRWLLREFHQHSGKPPRSKALQDAISFLEARAQFDAPEKQVWVRVAEFESRVYVDLCNAKWEAVEISNEGWNVISDPPVRFRRTKAMRALPHPARDGRITVLRKLLNIGSDADWTLSMAWLLGALRPSGPYPILLLHGEQGSAKSTTARLLRRIIDPVVAPIRTPPRSDRDLLIAASNSWAVVYDNLSGIPHWLSDALCRLATGGGFSTRELYTDSDEVIFDAMRPVILNGIDFLPERADLAERAIVLNLPRILPTDRKDEKQIVAAFEGELPKILGALYSAVGVALAHLDSVHLNEMPRMADFAMWASAGMAAFDLSQRTFLSAYRGNRADAVREALEADVVAAAISELIDRDQADDGFSWEGSCKNLLSDLGGVAGESTQKSRDWPKTPRGLSSKLRRLSTFMRESGVAITFLQRGARGYRAVRIEKGLQTTVTSVTTATSE